MEEKRTFSSRLKHAWNAFFNRDAPPVKIYDEYASSYRPDRPRFSGGNERSIVTSVYNRIAVDVSDIAIKHVKLDEKERYKETIKSGLNNCLTLETNADQTARAFKQDIVMSLFDEGCIAIVPTDADDSVYEDSFGIEELRTGKILEWRPEYVKVNVYNENTGKREDIWMPKKSVAIIENPFYAVMNEQNSVSKRLIHKLNILDAIDEQSGSGKLDLIIQLPYTVRSEARKQQAKNRKADIEQQLQNSKYGIAYIDAAEHITQLNRSVDNNLMKQIEYLTSMLYSQLGVTQEILDGSANEQTMLNYQNRTVVPVVSAIVDEMKRKFLTKTARTQGKTIKYFVNPFKYVSVSQLSEMSDKMTRNEILTTNEVRDIIGYAPSDDPSADELRNKNLSAPSESTPKIETTNSPTEEIQNG